MVCYSSCSVSIVFLSAMLYLTLFSDKNAIIKDFMTSLTPENKEKYKNIVKERQQIYLTGFVYGLIISFTLLYIFHKTLNKKLLICFTVATSYIVMYLYYILYPKSDYIILYLNNQQDREKWLKIYKHMQKTYHIGILFGLIFVSLMSYSLI